MKIRLIFLLIAVILLIGIAKAVTNDYISYWKANDNMLDENTTSANNGYSANGLGYVAGKYGSAFNFNGSTSMSAGSSATLNLTSAYTITFWINKTNHSINSNVYTILDKSGGGSAGYRSIDFFGDIYIANRQGFDNVAIASIQSTSVPNNTWHHLGYSWNGTAIQIYLDGVLSSTGYGNSSLTTTGNLSFGSYADNTEFGNFSADEIRIYNRALTNAEINATMSEESGNVTLNCTDAGSDGVADNIITVSTSNATSNCFVNGVDDNIELQMAFDNATLIGTPSNKGKVKLLSGVYSINNKTAENDGSRNGTIFIKNNTELYGIRETSIIRVADWANWGRVSTCVGNPHNQSNVTILSTEIPMVGINASGAHDVDIYNITIDGNYENECELMDAGNSAFYTEIQIRGITNLTIHHINFNKTNYDAIRVASGFMGDSAGTGENISIYNNTINSPRHAGVNILGSSNVTAYNNDIITSSNGGMRASHTFDHVVFKDNVIHGGAGSNFGIEITCGQSNVCVNSSILNNTIYAQGYDGIIFFLEDAFTGTFDNFTIKNNIVYQSGFNNAPNFNGIGIHEANNTVLDGNTIYNNNGNGIEFGIYVDYPFESPAGTLFSTVKNNIITDNDEYGISIGNGTYSVTESYNLYYNNTLGNNNTNITLGTGTITGQDPLFVNISWRKYGAYPDNEIIERVLDFHLKGNQTWNATTSLWDTYNVTSPAIGAGNPASDNSLSHWYPTQTIREMGAYGNTLYASESGSTIIINFQGATPANGTSTTNTSILVNITTTNANLSHFLFNWNGTNYTFYSPNLLLNVNCNNNSAIGENATHIVDISQYHNNGTWGGTQSENYTAGVYGSACNFDATKNTFVNFGNSDSLNMTLALGAQITFEAIENISTFNSGTVEASHILSKDLTGYIYFNENRTPDYHTLSTYFTGAVETFADYGILSLNISQRTSMTSNGTSLNFFVDGRNGGKFSKSFALAGNTVPLYMGNRVAVDRGLTGRLDEVRLWNRSFTDDEMQKHANASFEKTNNTSFTFTINLSSLSPGTYSYYGFTNDTTNSVFTERRTVTIASTPTPTSTTNVSVSSYVQSTCASTLNWGIVGASLITVLLIVVAGGLVFGFLPGNFKMDTFPIQEFALTVIAVVVIGSIGVAIISPIITVIGCP